MLDSPQGNSKPKSKGRIGRRTYFQGNAAVAHIKAAASFLDGHRDHGGRAYFITDGHPANFFTFFDGIIETAGYRIRPINLRIPFFLLYLLGVLVELFTLPVRSLLRRAPRISRFAAIYTCTSYTFTSRTAESDFGFSPMYTEEEVVSRTVEFYREDRTGAI